jgi:hypothetical protein
VPETEPVALVVIDDAFIREWHPKYDLTESDESEYQRLLVVTARDLDIADTVSKETFLAIWKWKGALRVIQHVRLDEYDSRYATAFHRAAAAPPERKLACLLVPGVKLPGVEAPTGSTLLHFMHPQMIPIIDVRTVEVLHSAGLLSTDRRDLAHFEEFRQAIEAIRRRCPAWSLRQIDRALFAYHKQFLEKDRARQEGKASGRFLAARVQECGHSAPRSYSAPLTRNMTGTNHDRFASVFKNLAGRTLSTTEIMTLMLSGSDIQRGSVLPTTERAIRENVRASGQRGRFSTG